MSEDEASPSDRRPLATGPPTRADVADGDSALALDAQRTLALPVPRPGSGAAQSRPYSRQYSARSTSSSRSGQRGHREVTLRPASANETGGGSRPAEPPAPAQQQGSSRTLFSGAELVMDGGGERAASGEPSAAANGRSSHAPESPTRSPARGGTGGAGGANANGGNCGGTVPAGGSTLSPISLSRAGASRARRPPVPPSSAVSGRGDEMFHRWQRTQEELQFKWVDAEVLADKLKQEQTRHLASIQQLNVERDLRCAARAADLGAPPRLTSARSVAAGNAWRRGCRRWRSRTNSWRSSWKSSCSP